MIRPKRDVNLSDLTTVGIGGPAKYFYIAKSAEKLIEAITFAKSKNLKYFVIGGGSNVLFADIGFDGLVIKNEVKGIVGFKGIFKVGTGVKLDQLVKLTVKQNCSGLQKLAGIPGTVGGAVFGNAGAYGQTISDYLTKVSVFDSETEKVIVLPKSKCQFAYRDSIFKKNHFLILEVNFKFLTSQELAPKEMEEILKDRKGKNFWQYKSPGSFFKNVLAKDLPEKTLKLIPKDKINHGKIPAGYLLEQVNAKGMQEGKVKVSDNHANLIVNLGSGTYSDYLKLTNKLQAKVKDKFGIKLEPEVQIIKS